MKVLHVLGAIYPERGGPAKVGPELCAALVKRGLDVSIYTTNLNIKNYLDVPVNEPIDIDGVQVTYYPVLISRSYGFSPSLGHALRLNVSNFDLVHIHSLYMYHSTAAAHFCNKSHIPYIVRPHGTISPFFQKKGRLKKFGYNLIFEYRNLNNAAALHVLSESEKVLVEKTMNLKSPSIVVPIGINPKEYIQFPNDNRFRNLYPELKDKFLYLFLGRIANEKGLDILCNAFANIAQYRNDVHLVIAGPDETSYMSKVNQWLSDLGILNRTTYVGMLKGEMKLAAFKDADVFVLSGYFENFGVALIEAMASGLPVVITNKVGIWNEISNSNAGIVTECKVDDFEEGMKYLLENPELLATFGKNGEMLVNEKFTWDKNVDLMIDMYEKIISREKLG